MIRNARQRSSALAQPQVIQPQPEPQRCCCGLQRHVNPNTPDWSVGRCRCCENHTKAFWCTEEEETGKYCHRCAETRALKQAMQRKGETYASPISP